jgi:hypothetical protein
MSYLTPKNTFAFLVNQSNGSSQIDRKRHAESSAQDIATVSCAGTGCGAQDVVTRSCAAQGVAQDMARFAQDMVTESCVFGIISCAAHRMW